MSPFSGFSEQFLVAAYLENRRIGDAVESGLIARSYNLKFGPNWIVRVVEEAIKRGWMAGSVNAGGDEYQVVYLTGAGMIEAERLIGLGVKLTWHGVTIEGDNDVKSDVQAADPLNSSSWTGLPSNFVLTEQKREKLVTMLHNADVALDSVGATNHEKAMARAYIVAARTLADAPDPPADLIWELINRANHLSGIASLFVSIMALFASVAN
jgi:hypothetical protein